MALSKICSRCQGIMPYTNKICDKCKDIVGSHRATSDKIYQDNRKDKEYQAIYRDHRWKIVRKQALLRANGLCEKCMSNGKISYVEDVHHIVPIKANILKAFDITNLICLCRKCHIDAHKDLNNTKSTPSYRL